MNSTSAKTVLKVSSLGHVFAKATVKHFSTSCESMLWHNFAYENTDHLKTI